MSNLIFRRFSLRGLISAFTALFVLAMATTIGHYANEVRIARNDTPALVVQAWQCYGKHLSVRDLPPKRLQMLLAVEDPFFFEHRGVDLATPGAGMTTITQGLVKLMYFPDGFHQGIAKIRQTLIAQYALDALVSKNEQLDLLLNIAYLGNTDGRAIHGFSNAARTYFGKEFDALSDTEFLSLVAMLIAPNRYTPGSPAHAERMQRVEAVLSGTYRPLSILDAEYNGTVSGTFAEEALMALLRIITEAKP